MSIRKKFNAFKGELKDIYYSDMNFCRLDITQCSLDELVRTGYVHRKIESFFFLNEFSEKEINEIFCDECADIDIETLGPLDIRDERIKVIDVLRNTKCESVKCLLWHELVNFIHLLKNNHPFNSNN